MTGRAPEPALGGCYRVTDEPRPALRLLAACAVALTAASCSMPASFTLPGFESGDGNDAAPAGSTDLIPALSSGGFSDDDLAAATTMASLLLPHGSGGRWENPRSGARGTITPIAAVYRDNGTACRDFLVSYVHDKTEAWMQGEACHDSDSRWEVRSLKPWRR